MEWKRAIRLIRDYSEENVKIMYYEELVNEPKELSDNVIVPESTTEHSYRI